MQRRAFLTLASALSLSTLIGRAGPASAEPPQVTGPFVHENLAVYLVHGKSAPGPVPLTLEEALARGAVEVRETGSVNELEIENLSDLEVFVQGGDIVKGGRQDRVLAVSLLLPQKSGKLPISAFCVEQGRWAKRGVESDRKFSAVTEMLPSREAKLAMRALPAEPARVPGRNANTVLEGRIDRHAGTGTANAQGEVWAKVGQLQDKLGANLGGEVRSAASASSLQLSLENEKLGAAQKAFLDALTPRVVEAEDAVGYVAVVNGKIASADVYASNALFRKLVPRALKAAATEAIGLKDQLPKAIEPSLAAVASFLAEAEKAEAKPAALPLKTIVGDSRKSKAALQSETRKADGSLVHRNVLAF